MSEGGQKYMVKRLASQAVAEGRQLGSTKNEFLALAFAQVEAKMRESSHLLRDPSLRESPSGQRPGWASLSRRSEQEVPTAHDGSLAAHIGDRVQLQPIAPAATGTTAVALRAKLDEVKGWLSTASNSEGQGSQYESQASVSSSFTTPREPLPAIRRSSENSSPPWRARINPNATGSHHSPQPGFTGTDTNGAVCR
jgi:hypothetical protein